MPKSYKNVKKITRLKFERSPVLLAGNRFKLIRCKVPSLGSKLFFDNLS